LNKLLGRNEIEDALKRLETLNVEEDRMATAVILNVVQNLDKKVTQRIDGGGKCISLVIHTSLKMDFTRSKSSKPRREPVTRKTSGVALSSGSLDKL